ncbi:MAG: transposase [Nitrososphaerota archaeon]|jgi:transposase|nr:transposase [Nitrososphaerota archaeon]
MGYIETKNKNQAYLPTTINQYITQDNPTKIIDAFIDAIDLKQLGFTKTTPKKEGRPAYAPQTLTKLWIYAYTNKIHSSRKLAKETTRKESLPIKNKLSKQSIPFNRERACVLTNAKENGAANKNFFRVQAAI